MLEFFHRCDATEELSLGFSECWAGFHEIDGLDSSRKRLEVADGL